MCGTFSCYKDRLIESHKKREISLNAHRLSLVLALFLLGSVATAQATTSPLSAPERADTRAALKALDLEQTEVAAAHAARLQHPLTMKLVAWRTFLLKAEEGNFYALRDFVNANPDWPRQYGLRRKAEKIMPETLPPAEVAAWFDAHTPVTGAGALRYADALSALGRTDDLKETVNQAWQARDFEAKDETAFYKNYGAMIDFAGHKFRLERLLRERKSTAARRQAKRMGKGYPQLTDARLRLAARSPGVDAAIKRVPASLHGDAGLLYERTRWRQRKGRYDGVVELLDPPRPGLPDVDRWWPLRHWAARKGLDKGDYKTAYRIAAGHGAERGLIFAEGEFLAGWIALRFVKDPKRALPHFKALYEGVTSPISRGRGAYWAGRAAKAAGDTAEAERWFDLAAKHPETYYGQLAVAELGREITIDLPRDGQPSSAEREAFRAQELAQVAVILGDLEAWDLQRAFINQLLKGAETANAYRLAAEFARSQGRADIAVRTAKTARRDGIILSDQLYPLRPIVTHNGLEKALVLSLVRQESSFYPRAKSRAGALGLMQLLPGTAKGVASKEGLPYTRARLTEDPDFNLRLGQRYLADLIVRFRGNVPMALAGYNAGPGRVDRWIRDYGDPRSPNVDQIDWIERIPFNETRNYVQRITENVPVYQQRLAQPQAYIASPTIVQPSEGQP